MPLSESLQAQALRELQDTVCAVCGSIKESRKSFCTPCFKSLPESKRRALYQPFSNGYAQIYDACKDYLRIETDRGAGR